METPNYSTKPNITRILMPRIISLVFLAALLYAGIRVNLAVFNIEFPSSANMITTAAIITAAAADLIIAGMKNKDNKIYFFSDRIEVKGKKPKTIALGAISSAEVKKNLYDMILDTGDIRLSNGQAIKNLNCPERISQYITQLIRMPPQKV